MTKKRTQAELRRIRERIYAEEVYCMKFLPKQAMLQELLRDGKGSFFHVPDPASRISNFKQLVKENFFTDEWSPLHWPAGKENLHAYRMFMGYAKTPYGAAMVCRILKDNKKQKDPDRRFKIKYNAKIMEPGMARGQYNWMILTPNFDMGRHPGGEKRFGLSMIHHEFGHTRFGFLRDHFLKHDNSGNINIQEERLTVRYFSNPVRIYHDYEPRYTYTVPLDRPEKGPTINILNPKLIHPSAITVKEDDPRVFAKIGSPGARKWAN